MSSIQARLLAAAAALCVTSCNAALGGGMVAVLGGAGYLAAQCYDRVQVRVLDPATGAATCDADVSVADAEGSERRLRPCYNAALTEGTWRITARRAGYAPASTELTIAEHDTCPHYTHSVQLTLRREGEPPTNPVARSRPDAAPAAPTAPASDLESPRARVVPPPLPGVPTRAFEPVPRAPAQPPAPTPAAPTPAAPTPAAPAPAAPAPTPPPE